METFGPFTALLLLMLVSCTLQSVDGKSPLHLKTTKHRIPGQYIVVLQDDVDVNMFARAFETSVLRGTSEGEIKHKYQHTIKGFSAKLSKDTVDKLRYSDHVKYIEEDGIVRALGVNSWGQGRVDQRNMPLDDNTPSFLGDGANTHVYIVDTGTLYTHKEFSGRTGNGFDYFDEAVGTDCHGHGTHCGGTAAGNMYGIANKATVHSVRVLNCDGEGSLTAILNGLEWVAQNKIDPAVVSMSLEGPFSQSENDVIQGMVNAGMVVSVAAGNGDVDACTKSPASAPAALTVGATDYQDKRASFSNYGSCVDIFAPGVGIKSSWIGSDLTKTIDGTSMACPHVSGAAAALLSVDRNLTPAQVTDKLLRASTINKVTDAKLTANRLLYIGKDTCMVRCGNANDASESCQCDAGCSSRGDCCTDYGYLCGANAPSCSGRCDSASNSAYPCQCDQSCVSRSDCCPNYEPICGAPTPTQCHSDVTTIDNPIMSPSYPSDYGDNRSCYTRITASPSNKVVMLVFKTFNLEYEYNCDYDSLSIYDGADASASLFGKYCGADSPGTLVSTRQHMYLHLTSDASVSFPGYTADVLFINAFRTTDCNAALSQEGSFTSPNYFEEYYNNMECGSVITAGSGQTVRLTFHSFSVEADGTACRWDSLLAYDGSDASGNLLGRYCGDDKPDAIESTGQSLFMKFKSDYSITSAGFHADVDFIGGAKKTLMKPTPTTPQKSRDNDVIPGAAKKTLMKPTPTTPQKTGDDDVIPDA